MIVTASSIWPFTSRVVTPRALSFASLSGRFRASWLKMTATLPVVSPRKPRVATSMDDASAEAPVASLILSMVRAYSCPRPIRFGMTWTRSETILVRSWKAAMPVPIRRPLNTSPAAVFRLPRTDFRPLSPVWSAFTESDASSFRRLDAASRRMSVLLRPNSRSCFSPPSQPAAGALPMASRNACPSVFAAALPSVFAVVSDSR